MKQTFKMPPSKREGEDDKAYYYIHRHISNFENKNSATQEYLVQKHLSYATMKGRYRRNYMERIEPMNPEAMARLEDSLSKDKILTNIDKDILKVLNSNVSKAVQNFNLEHYMRSSYKNLYTVIENPEDIKTLEELFGAIADASDILTDGLKNDNFHMAMLQLAGVIHTTEFPEYMKILDKVKEFYANQDIVASRATKEGVVAILDQVGKLATGLHDKTTSAKTLQKYLTNIFATQLGEYVVSKGVKKALNYYVESIDKTLTGTKNVKVTHDKQLLEFISKYGQKGNQVYKTDNSFKHIAIRVEDGSEFQVELGLSTKWYSDAGLGSGGVSVTGETQFVNRIFQIFNNEEDKYNAYNVLALAQQDAIAYGALKSMIIARNIDTIISGLGAENDFAQFIVINGTFYSIWQLISVLEDYNLGQGGFGRGGATDPVTISPGGLAKVLDQTREAQQHPKNLYKAYWRSRYQNQLIEDLTLTGRFYPRRLKNIITSDKRFAEFKV